MPQEVISSFEKTVQSKSRYAQRLKFKYGKPSYYNLLKGMLLKKFNESEVSPLFFRDTFNYLIISRNFTSQLNNGLKSLLNLISEGERNYLKVKIDELSGVIDKLYSRAVEGEIPPLIFEIGIKRWIKENVESGDYIPVYKKITLMLQLLRGKKMGDMSYNKRVFEFLKKSAPVKTFLDRTGITYFRRFFEYPELFLEVLEIIKNKVIPPISVKHPSDNTKEMKKNIKRTNKKLKSEIKGQVEKLLESIDRENLDAILDNIHVIGRRVRGGSFEIKELRDRIRMAKIMSEEREFDTPELLRYYEPDLESKIEEKWDEVITYMQSGLDNVPEDLIETSFLGRKINVEGIMSWFLERYNEKFIPIVTELIMEEMIRVFPSEEMQRNMEEARWIGLLARKNEKRSVYFIPEIKREPDKSDKIVQDFYETVSVLIYDIRGSSMMGERLRDAEMENEILKDFQKTLLKAVEETNGFFLKETGDGGIIFFSRNSGELDLKVRSEHSEGDFSLDLKTDRNSTRRAIKCAMKMIEYSQNFVRKNLNKYSDWFKQLPGEEIDFGGVTYETLPPQYKKIFQIGVGIESGQPGRDIYMDKNVIDRVDLTGNLVRRANIFSRVHHPDRSVILIGHGAMSNFLLNVEEFMSPDESLDLKKHSYASREKAFRSELIRWLKGLPGNYRIREYKASLRRIEYLLQPDSEKREVDVPGESVNLEEREAVNNSKVNMEHIVYEVIPEK